MKLSAINQIKGTVTSITEGVVNAKVTIDIGGGNVITSVISVDAAKDLDLAIGSEVVAIIKSSSVILGTM